MVSVDTQVPSTRKEALELGLPRYNPQIECVHGHISDRSAKSGNCLECRKTTHKEKIKDLCKKYIKGLPDSKRMERVDKHVARAKRKNNDLKVRAKNAGLQFSQRELRVIKQKKADGSYTLTAERLAQILGRSLKSIECARIQHRY